MSEQQDFVRSRHKARARLQLHYARTAYREYLGGGDDWYREVAVQEATHAANNFEAAGAEGAAKWSESCVEEIREVAE